MVAAPNLLQAEIRKTRNADRISIASPCDFAVRGHMRMSLDAARELSLLPYCLDFVRRSSVYVGGVEAHAAQQAPFYYLHLRRAARSVVRVPWATGPLHDAADREPVLMFSPGRCGSTLLSQVLFEAGVANVSEPDFYTQSTSALCSSRFNPLGAQVRRAVGAMGQDLCAALAPTGGPVVAKLRAESCRAPGYLLQAGERRTLFMSRGFESWARSNLRAFRNPPRKTVDKYLRSLACHAYLMVNSDCHFIRYEDAISDPLRSFGALAAFLSVEISPAAIAAAMKKDSQDGTPLAQGARAEPEGWENRLEETLALWNSDRVKSLRSRLDPVGLSDN